MDIEGPLLRPRAVADRTHPRRAQLLSSWPVLRQMHGDPFGLGRAAQSRRSREMRPRTDGAERVVRSICPYCAVGCGQRVFVEEGSVTQIEGDPDSPISRGRLCPKGSATRHYVTSPLREYTVKYRRPFGAQWEDLSLEQAMDMISDRVIESRRRTWEGVDEQGRSLNRTLGIASLGGATLDNEENYLIKKLFTGLGIVSVENQARI
jgi:formate dehydrogenase major subunit